MDYIYNTFYFIGTYGPIVLFILTCILLWNKKTMIFYYIVFFSINTILNLILKGIFQQPRPIENQRQFKAMVKHGKTMIFKDSGIPFNVFGMPSGHLQSCLFSTVFTFLVLKRIDVLLLFLLITFITLVQRVHCNFHTLLQTIVGSFCGLFFAFIAFYFSKEKLKGKNREKRDDNGPI